MFLKGQDQQKLAVLRQLSGSDLLSTQWRSVPESFRIVNLSGEEMLGAAHASMLPDPNTHPNLFGPLMDELAKQMPTQRCSKNGESPPVMRRKLLRSRRNWCRCFNYRRHPKQIFGITAYRSWQASEGGYDGPKIC